MYVVWCNKSDDDGDVVNASRNVFYPKFNFFRGKMYIFACKTLKQSINQEYMCIESERC